MKSFTLGAALLLGSLASTLAMPTSQDMYQSEDSTCCCCDSSLGVISCTNSIEVIQCSCLAVDCPGDAPTVFEEIHIPRKTPEILPSDEVECCCCDISQPAISCKMQPAEEGCFCPFVVCPPNAPTVYPELTSTSTTVIPTPTQSVHNEEGPCCCCDPFQLVISCKELPKEEECICPLILCPSDAATVFPELTPTSTPTTPIPTTPVPEDTQKKTSHVVAATRSRWSTAS